MPVLINAPIRLESDDVAGLARIESSLLKQTIKRVLPAGAIRFARGMVADLARPAKLRRARATGSRLKHYVPGRRTVLFFVPEGGVRLYLVEQAILGRTLRDLGHNVLFVRCFDVFPRCPYKDSVLMPFE